MLLTKHKKLVIGLMLTVAITAFACFSFFVGQAGNQAGKSPLFSVEKYNSFVEYGTYKVSEHDFANKLDDQDCAVNGAIVRLASGDVLKYNKAIDLTGKTADDLLARIVITPDSIGTMDFSNIYVELTDVYDETNVVSIWVSGVGESWGRAYTLVKAGENQLYSGWDHNQNILAVGEYGYPFALSFAGDVNSSNFIAWPGLTIADNSLAFTFDYANRAIYHRERKSSLTSALVTDLDDPDERSELWGGFTTGECFLSIRCDSYYGATANFVVSEVAGEKVTSDMSFEKTAPDVTVDFGEYTESNLPVGVKGEAYPLFKGTAMSPYYSDLTVNVKAYLITSNGKKTATVENGKLIPDAAGEYSIEYSVTDENGKTGTKSYKIIVAETATAITSEIGEKQTEAIAGHYVTLPEVTVGGGSGNKKVSYSIVCGGKNVETKGKTFFANRGGEYEVTVTVTDYIGKTKTDVYTVVVADGTKPVFTESVLLPKYFISGEKYSLPALAAKNFTDGSGSAIAAKITYVDSDGEKTARNGNEITPKVNSNGDVVRVIYTATLNGVSESVEYSVPVVKIFTDAGKVNHANLIYTEGFNKVTIPAKGIRLDFSSDTYFDYVNPAVANGLNVKFGGVTGFTNYSEFTITLADYANADERVVLHYRPSVDGVKFFINDDETHALKILKLFNGDNTFNLTLDNISYTVQYGTQNTQKANIKTYENGTEFKGFSSGMVYVTFSFENVNSDSAFMISAINGKNKFSSDTDTLKPKIGVFAERGGDRSINSEIEVPKAVATDVVDGAVKVLFTVYAPDGSVCYDIDGVYLNNVPADEKHVVKYDEYGKYEIHYTAADRFGNTEETSYIVRIVDEIPPIMTVNGSINAKVKVGDRIKLPSVTVDDNYDEEITVYVCCVTDTGNIIDVSGGIFVPIREGKYTIRYYCFDKAGNYVSRDFDFEAERS